MTKEEGWTFAGLTPKTWTYTYDAAGRLWEASDGLTTKVYEYDPNGNRLGATVDAQDRVTSQTDSGTTTTYSYDDHGNVVTRARTGVSPLPEQGLTWDSEGSLKSVVQANTVSYQVDARGRRVGRKVNGTLDREWLYDGQLRIVGEVIPGATARYRLYGYLPERHLPVMMTETISVVTKTYRIYGDHLGSLRAVVESATGNVVQVMQHGPLGEVDVDTVTGGFVRVPFGFAGGNYDEQTGLVRFGAREYDSGTGRWLSKDEARFEGGRNFYEYANGNPCSVVDPSGYAPSGIPAPSRDHGIFSRGGSLRIGTCVAIAIKTALPPSRRPSTPKRWSARWGTGFVTTRGIMTRPTYRGTAAWNHGYQCSYDVRGDLSSDGVRRGSYDDSPPNESMTGRLIDDVVPAYAFGTGYFDEIDVPGLEHVPFPMGLTDPMWMVLDD